MPKEEEELVTKIKSALPSSIFSELENNPSLQRTSRNIFRFKTRQAQVPVLEKENVDPNYKICIYIKNLIRMKIRRKMPQFPNLRRLALSNNRKDDYYHLVSIYCQEIEATVHDLMHDNFLIDE